MVLKVNSIKKCVSEFEKGISLSMVKYWTTEMACRAADWCLQLHDGYGYCEEYPIASAWRDTRTSRIMGGTTEIMNGIITEALWL